MLTRIFDSPVIDILLLILVIRFIFPRLFVIRPARPAPPGQEHDRVKVNRNGKNRTPEPQKKEGEYIDFEEVK